jgi:hypothetical protein
MRISNKDRFSARPRLRHSPTLTGFAEIVSDDFPAIQPTAKGISTSIFRM